jgi:hypothetical protein
MEMNAMRWHTEEAGHVAPVVGTLPAIAGAILLGIGAANDTGWLAVAGGIVLAAGILVYETVRHLRSDWSILERLDRLEGKQ